MNDIILSTQNGEPVVSSRQIAETLARITVTFSGR